MAQRIEGKALSRRLPTAFAEQPRAAQITAAVAAPMALGVVSGVLLGVSAGAYWVVQVLAAVGGALAGLEHEGAAAGACRGLAGGVLYGSLLLITHSVSGLHERVSPGHPAILLVVFTALFGSGLGALGGRLRARATT